MLRREGASILVGDHVHDVEGARAAGVISVSVLTGGCTAEELVEGGTDVVLADLTVFPDWLDAHVATSPRAAYPLAPPGVCRIGFASRRTPRSSPAPRRLQQKR